MARDLPECCDITDMQLVKDASGSYVLAVVCVRSAYRHMWHASMLCHLACDTWGGESVFVIYILTVPYNIWFG